MALKSDGLVSVIKYEGNNDTLVWKYPTEDFKYGSQLIVHETQEAIFFRDGQALDLFGPGRYTLETQILLILEKAYKLPTGGEQAFHSEVYFINKTVQMALKWGTPEKLRFIDPLTGVPLELGASGEMNLQVSNSRKLLVKLVGTMEGIAWEDRANLAQSLQVSFRPLITNAVKVHLSNVISSEAIDILEVDSKLDLLSEKLREKILPGFEAYGLNIPQFYLTSVVLPENDPNFKRIRELHTITLQTRYYQAEATVLTAKAQSEAQYRIAQEQSKAAVTAAHREAVLQEQTTQTEIARREAERTVISAEAEAKAQRLAGLTEAEIMAAKGYNQKDVLQAEVQKAYAEGIGNMGPAISAGGGGSGMLGDMLGLGVGMAAASAIAPQVGNMLQGFQNPSVSAGKGSPLQDPAAAAGTAGTQGSGGSNYASGTEGWDCPQCGTKRIQTRFCPECGAKKPGPISGPATDIWNCPSCGAKGIRSRFCPECGSKRPEPSTWTCPECGTANITTKFCPNCGYKRER